MATAFGPSRVSFWQESVQGTPPADAATWASEGTSIRHVAGSVDLSSLVASMIEDQRSQLNISDYDPWIIGIEGGGTPEVPTDYYLHGTGQSPADGSPVTADALHTLGAHSWGGGALGTSDNLVTDGAHTSTAIELTDTLADGSWVGLDDPTTGLRHLRRIESSADGAEGRLHQLHRELPWTPDDGETALGCAVTYLDEDILEDSSQGPYTLSYLWERGRGAQRRTWLGRGCKTSITGIRLARNELAMLSTTTRVGSYLTPESAPVPSWSNSIEGSAGSVVGPRTRVWLQDRGTTTDSTVQVSAFELDPGLLSAPIETQTSDATNMPGLFGYILQRGSCSLSLSVVPHADGPLTDFGNRTEKSIQWERTTAGAGAWCVYLPRATYSGTPALADVSTALGQQLQFTGHHDDNLSTALGRSRAVIVRC